MNRPVTVTAPAARGAGGTPWAISVAPSGAELEEAWATGQRGNHGQGRCSDVAAGITWDPHVSRALQSGKARVLIGAKDIMPIKQGHYIGNGFYGRTDFIDKNPELVQEVVNALVKAIDVILEDPKGAAQMWSDATGLPIEVLNYSVDNKISVFDRDIAPSKETVDAYTKFLKDAGILKPEDNPKYDATFALKALEG